MELIIKQLAIFLLFLSTTLTAQTDGEIFYIFKKLPPKKHGIIVKFTDRAKIQLGTILQATAENGEKCNLKVIKIKSSLALVATDYCTFEEKLKKDQQLTRVSKKAFKFVKKAGVPFVYKRLDGDQLISIKLPKNSRIKPGMGLVATQFEKSSCIIKVVRVYDTYAIGETINCPFRSELRENQPLMPLVINDPKKKDIGKFLVKQKGLGIIKPGFSKSWYTYWGVGYGTNSIDGPAANITMNGQNHMEFTVDLLGFYLPYKKTNFLYGGVLNILFDSFTYTSYDVSYIHLMPSFSALYFLGPEAGKQWFLRADLGLAKYLLSVNTINSTSSLGIGILFGGGYSWKLNFLNRDFSLLTGLYYTRREVTSLNDAFSISSLTLSIGLLF